MNFFRCVCRNVDLGDLRLVDVVDEREEGGEAVMDGAEGAGCEVAVAAGPRLGGFVD